jgi:hypothetical protein
VLNDVLNCSHSRLLVRLVHLTKKLRQVRKPSLQGVDHELVFAGEAVSPDVEGGPVADVEEDEEKRKHDKKNLKKMGLGIIS